MTIIEEIEQIFTFPENVQNLNIRQVTGIAGGQPAIWKQRIHSGEILGIRLGSQKLYIPAVELKRFLAERVVNTQKEAS